MDTSQDQPLSISDGEMSSLLYAIIDLVTEGYGSFNHLRVTIVRDNAEHPARRAVYDESDNKLTIYELSTSSSEH